MSLDGISMHPLSIEIDRAVAGGRIDRINQPNKQSIILLVRQPGKNLMVNISINPQNPAVHLIEKAPDNPTEPPMFCMVLRKHLETGRIARVYQQGLDRLLIMDIDVLAAGGQIVTKSIVMELMGKYSNIILVQDGIIIDALRKVGTNSSRVRTILPGDAYEFPPVQDKLNLLTESLDDLVTNTEVPFIPSPIMTSIRRQTEEKLHKAILNVCLGFGPVTAKEAAYMAGLAPNTLVSDMAEGDFDKLKKSLAKLKTAFSEPQDESVIITDKNNKVLATSAFPLTYIPSINSEANILIFPNISDMLSKAGNLFGSYQLPDRDRFQKLVKNELNRAENKVVKLEEEINDSENAEEFRKKADNLMTYQYQLTDHVDASVTVADIYSETSEEITIKLDQRLTISQNVQWYYKKYDKLKRGKEILIEQKKQCLEDIAYLSTVENSLKSSTRLNEINDIKAELIATGFLREKVKKKASEKPSQPFKFTAPDCTVILVGKNNYQNDRLTFKVSNPGDIWLHTKEIPGSHVILRCDGDEPSEETLLLSAYLAVHFSKAEGSSKVPVDYTRCRFMKKPNGSKPGFVIFTNQTTLYVTPEEEVLAPILKQID